MQKYCSAPKKKGKNFPLRISLANQIKPIKFSLDARAICIIKCFLMICILLC
jgi:hypothetical protein